MTKKQVVSNLKAKLAKVKEEAHLAREAAEKVVATSGRKMIASAMK